MSSARDENGKTSAVPPPEVCSPCRRDNGSPWLLRRAATMCRSCQQAKTLQVHFRAAQYWLEFRSFKLMRALARAEARIASALGGPSRQGPVILTAAYEENVMLALTKLSARVSYCVLRGIPGWMSFSGEQVQNLLCDTVGPSLPTSRLDVERIGSDGFHLASASRVGPVLAPSHKGHLITLSLGGQSVRWGVLPLAFGVGACDASVVRRVLGCIELPQPRRVRLYLPDQGELYAIADCHSSCFFCHLSPALIRSVFQNCVVDILARDTVNLVTDWPEFAATFAGLRITSIAQVAVAPLHWLSIVYTQFLKFKWNEIGDYVRSQIRGCANLDLSDDAPAIAHGVQQQRTGISIKSLTALLRDSSFDTRLSAVSTSAPRRVGQEAVSVCERDLHAAIKRLRFEDCDAAACSDAMQTVVDVFFANPHLSTFWTRGCHAGLHIVQTLQAYSLTLSDVLEQNIEHSNQEADCLSEQYGGDGVRVGTGLFRTALMLREGWVTVVNRAGDDFIAQATDPLLRLPMSPVSR